MSEALRRPIRRNPRLGHAVGRTARCFTQRTYGLGRLLSVALCRPLTIVSTLMTDNGAEFDFVEPGYTMR